MEHAARVFKDMELAALASNELSEAKHSFIDLDKEIAVNDGSCEAPFEPSGLEMPSQIELPRHRSISVIHYILIASQSQ